MNRNYRLLDWANGFAARGAPGAIASANAAGGLGAGLKEVL